jgi:hypothetical protein
MLLLGTVLNAPIDSSSLLNATIYDRPEVAAGYDERRGDRNVENSRSARNPRFRLADAGARGRRSRCQAAQGMSA